MGDTREQEERDTIQTTVRLPVGLHALTMELADQEDRSFNWVVVDALKKYMMLPDRRRR